MHTDAIINKLRERVPALAAVYLFGSRASGEATDQSDLDLAIAFDGPADPVRLWTLASDLENLSGCPVDLIDFRRASTVMQYRILMTGTRLWSRGADVDIYESFVLSEKTALDEARAGLIADIERTGTVHGR